MSTKQLSEVPMPCDLTVDMAIGCYLVPVFGSYGEHADLYWRHTGSAQDPNAAVTSERY